MISFMKFLNLTLNIWRNVVFTGLIHGLDVYVLIVKSVAIVTYLKIWMKKT